ncbi:MAG: hypothetical protein SOV74_04810, partial [Coriobacteriales bacterium]|nr:hypothetical protein [Coriobacteriales bacterium]
EVHMLSSAAFNALLKTLEEPPSHVIFVLCTTDPQKVPDTILSRCQRFDFHRFSVEEIVGRLAYISRQEGISVEAGALQIIARHVQGGMRDAIGSLEQLSAFTSKNITTSDAEGLLGEVDSAQLFDIVDLIASRDVAGCFSWIAKFTENGTDMMEFARDLTKHVRNLYVTALTGGHDGIVEGGEESVARYARQAARFEGTDRLARMLTILGELLGQLRYATDPRLNVEIALTRMARPTSDLTLESLAERIETLEARLSEVEPGAPRRAAVAEMAPAPEPRRESALQPEPQPEPAPSWEPEPRRESAPEPQLAPRTESAPQPEPAPGWEPQPQPKPAPQPEPQPQPQPAPTPESEPVEPPQIQPKQPADQGVLARDTAQRLWAATVRSIRQKRSAIGNTFAGTVVDVDPDGTLCIQFPSQGQFAIRLSERPENRATVREAIIETFGREVPFRYAASDQVAAPQIHREPAPQAFEQPQPAAAAAQGFAAASSRPAPTPQPEPVQNSFSDLMHDNPASVPSDPTYEEAPIDSYDDYVPSEDEPPVNDAPPVDPSYMLDPNYEPEPEPAFQPEPQPALAPEPQPAPSTPDGLNPDVASLLAGAFGGSINIQSADDE